MELTEKLFWEKFWNEIKLPQTVDYNFKNDRIIAETTLNKFSLNQKIFL